MMKALEFTRELETDGYAVLDLPAEDIVVEIRNSLEGEVKRLLSDDSVKLETYHEVGLSDDDHISLHYDIATYARERHFSRKILKA